MINNLFMIATAIILFAGCTTVKYNVAPQVTKLINYPELGAVVTAFVGDHLVESGYIVEEEVLQVNSHISGLYYEIPAKQYSQIGYDEKNFFYEPTGVIRSSMAQEAKALVIEKNSNSNLCVLPTMAVMKCYKGDFKKIKIVSKKGNSFQQTLIYSGRVGNKINISYREFSNNIARPAFSNDVEYDLSSSNKIGYKGAIIEVIMADNNTIKYKLLRSFHSITK